MRNRLARTKIMFLRAEMVSLKQALVLDFMKAKYGMMELKYIILWTNLSQMSEFPKVVH
jgi:hypothetical protein